MPVGGKKGKTALPACPCPPHTPLLCPLLCRYHLGATTALNALPCNGDTTDVPSREWGVSHGHALVCLGGREERCNASTVLGSGPRTLARRCV